MDYSDSAKKQYTGTPSLFYKAARPFITLAAAALTYFAASTGYSQDQPKAQEPPRTTQQRQKLPLELEHEHIASQAYVEGKKLYDANKREESISHFMKARKFYNAAENVEPKDELFKEERTSIDEWVAVARYNKKIEDLSPEQRSDLAKHIGDYEQGVAKPSPVQLTAPPQPQEQQHAPLAPAQEREQALAGVAKEAYDRAFAFAGTDLSPEHRKELTNAYQLFRAAESAVPETERFGKERIDLLNRVSNGVYGKPLADLADKEHANVYRFIEQLPDPYGDNRIVARGGLGSTKSSRDTSASVDARLYGLDVIAEWHNNKFREETSKDKIREQGFGGYAGVRDLAGLPLSLSVALDEDKRTRDSEDLSRTVTSQFDVTTLTKLREEETNSYQAGSAGLRLGSTTIRGIGYANEQKMKLTGNADTNVINLTDPSGNYRVNTPISDVFTNETTGFQFALEQRVSDQLSLGAMVTYEMTDMPDFNRTIDVLRPHLFAKYLSKDGTAGFRAIIGRSHLDDTGEENDGWQKGEYALAAGAELSDWLTAGVSFSYLENPRGSLWFLLGNSDRALEHILDMYDEQNRADINLLPHMSKDQQNIYLQNRHADLVHELALQNKWLLLADAGAGRVQTFEKGLLDDTYGFNGSATLFVPVDLDYTLTFEAFRRHESFHKDWGARFGLHTTKSGWAIQTEFAQEEGTGRLQDKEDFHFLFGARYTLPK